jgi:polygalacturonase
VDNTNKTLSTSAIQQAIDECSQNGGGIVKFNPGKYLTGSVFVKSNVNLQIDSGVQLIATQNLTYYTEIWTRVTGIELEWPAAVINVINATNAAITGSGKIDGQGMDCWDRIVTERPK